MLGYPPVPDALPVTAPVPPADTCDVPVTDEHDRSTLALPMSAANASRFMGARLFHSVLHPGDNYPKWLAETAASHPKDISNPNEGDAARISLIRAKNFAFHKGASSEGALNLITQAEGNGNDNPGAVADELFKNYAQQTISSSHGAVFAGTSGDASQAACIASDCHQSKAPFDFHRIDSSFVEQDPCDTSAESATSTASPPLPIPMTSAELLLAPSESHAERPAEEQAVEQAEEPAETPAVESAEIPGGLPDKLPEAEQSEEAADPPTAEHLNFEVVGPGPDTVENPVSEADVGDFNRLDQVVRIGLDTFIEVGSALAEINQRNLWRAGGHSSWAAYCHAHGLTKIHANRLIKGSALATRLAEVKPTGFTQSPICPRSEWQIRPLHKLQHPEQQNTAWIRAAERAGGQPTEQEVLAEVSEIVGNKPASASPKPSRKQLILDAFSALREAVRTDRPKEEIELRLAELERRLKLD
jgi:hypothetical protein